MQALRPQLGRQVERVAVLAKALGAAVDAEALPALGQPRRRVAVRPVEAVVFAAPVRIEVTDLEMYTEWAEAVGQ